MKASCTSVRSEKTKNHFQNLNRVVRLAIKKKKKKLAYLPVKDEMNNVLHTLLHRPTVPSATGPV